MFNPYKDIKRKILNKEINEMLRAFVRQSERKKVVFWLKLLESPENACHEAKAKQEISKLAFKISAQYGHCHKYWCGMIERFPKEDK